MHGSSVKLQRQREGDMEAGWCGAASGTSSEVEKVWSAAVRDEDGSVCSSPEAQQQRFSAEELGKVRQRSTRPDMAELPSEEEQLSAVGKMKSGKASGESSILPEMVRAACCEPDFMSRLLELVHDVWMTGAMLSWCLFPRRATSVAATI